MASSGRDRVFWSALWVFAVATSVSSMFFMALTFYVEANGGRMQFVEPNRYMAAAELATVVTGIIALLLIFNKGISGRTD